ncbi:MAG TPA: hypothetical protein VLL08_10185 [Kineosporiaceae bacterium]|nr:hypothetical protein [Kineosporiaceae bacterium]
MAEIQAVLAEAGKAKSSSAAVKLRTFADGRLAVVMTGRMNLSRPPSSRLQLRISPLSGQKARIIDEIRTPQALYVRGRTGSRQAAGRWQRLPDSAQGENLGVPNVTRYAQLLLKAGPSAVKQQKSINGAPATLLSGRIEADQIKKIEPSLYDRLRASGVDDFACDIWVDRKGRVVRFDQWLMLKGTSGHNVLTFTKFQGKMTVRPPI